jgi:hypothetical protein
MAKRTPGKDSLIKIRPRVETVQVSRGRTALVCDQHGEISPDRAIEGLYVRHFGMGGTHRGLCRERAAAPESQLASLSAESCTKEFILEKRQVSCQLKP